jgi:hypothetical protein
LTKVKISGERWMGMHLPLFTIGWRSSPISDLSWGLF